MGGAVQIRHRFVELFLIEAKDLLVVIRGFRIATRHGRERCQIEHCTGVLGVFVERLAVELGGLCMGSDAMACDSGCERLFSALHD